MVTKALIGEIFEEEERQLTSLYEAILLSLAEGEWNTAIIAGSLNSKGFNVTPSSVSGYLETLQNMGLVEKIPIYGEKKRARWYYKISSPIISLIFYSPYEDIDIVLLEKGKPIIGYEVKLGEFSKAEAEKSIERIRRAGIPKAGLISLKEKPNFNADEELGPEDLVRISRYVFQKYISKGNV
jgi:hypothetical protein